MEIQSHPGKQEVYFEKCSFCNVFELTDYRSSEDRPHEHEYMQIWYILRGGCEHHVDEQVYILNTGDTFLIPPKVSHRTVLRTGSTVISCEINLDAVLPPKSSGAGKEYRGVLDTMAMMLFLQDSKTRRPRFVFRPETGRMVEHLMRQILLEYQQEQPFYEDMLRVKVQELLLLFIREFRTSPTYCSTDTLYIRYRSLMDNVIHYIDTHYAEPLTLEDACRISTLSRTYFCYLFKLITKKTFVEYLTGIRIRNAIHLLETTSVSIQEISEQLGFSDAAHFSRTFKKVVGYSPSAYRKLRSGIAIPDAELTA